MPASIPSGNIQINFSNKESFPITHEMILKALPSGDTAQDIIDSAKVPGCEGGAECEGQYLAFGEIAGVDTGATLSNVFDLPAGDYFFACWETGTQSGGDGRSAARVDRDGVHVHGDVTGSTRSSVHRRGPAAPRSLRLGRRRAALLLSGCAQAGDLAASRQDVHSST